MVYLDAAVRRPQLVAAARAALAREGVPNTSLRAVATEAGVPLGTLQHVFPTKDQLLHAVIEDVVEEIASVLAATADADHGLGHAVRTGLLGFWEALVSSHRDLQVMQYELTLYALRSPGHVELARWQYRRYVDVVTGWCERAAASGPASDPASEVAPDRLAQLARLMVAGVDGLILQSVCDPDPERSRDDLDALVAMLTTLVDRPS